MRIISGQFKGRRIDISSKITARPTTDFAKEGLFNVLNNRIDFEDIEVLDLFAGTGSIGLEFVSRGCKSATCIEKEKAHCLYIQKVCKLLKIENMHVRHADVFRFLKIAGMQYDVVFADPPYALDSLQQIPDLIFDLSLLKTDGLLILEHSAKHQFNTHPNFVEIRIYGNVNFSFFANKAL